MASYEIAYEDQGTTLALKADLNAGWRKLTKTYGFNGSQKALLQAGLVNPSATDFNRAAFHFR